MKKLLFALSIIALLATSCRLFSAEPLPKLNGNITAPKLQGILTIEEAMKHDRWVANNPFVPMWDTGTLGPNDTTFTYSVEHASIVYFQFTDTAATGSRADSMIICIQNVSGNVTEKAPVAVHNLATTTGTTLVAFAIPGNGVSAVFTFTPSSILGKPTFTGTFFVARVNTSPGEAQYSVLCRYSVWYE